MGYDDDRPLKEVDPEMRNLAKVRVLSLGYQQGRFVIDREHPEFSEHHVHFFQKMVLDGLGPG